MSYTVKQLAGIAGAPQQHAAVGTWDCRCCKAWGRQLILGGCMLASRLRRTLLTDFLSSTAPV
jgi:hypothetical protein